MTRYLNFDLELFDYRREAASESYRLRVARACDGSEMGLAEAVSVTLPPGLRGRVQRLEKDLLDGAELIELGRQIADLLLPAGTPRSLFERSLSRLANGQGLRLRLRIEAPELAALPWELAYLDLPGTRPRERDERGFLTLRRQVSVVRHEVLAAPKSSFEPVARPRLVCLSSHAAAAGLAPLDLEAERAEIRAALAPGGIDVLTPERASLAALQRALDGGAQLFHYAGHGQFEEQMGEIPRTSEGKGYLLLEADDGSALEVPAETVGLNLEGAGVRFALLNGCETGKRDVAHSWSGIAPLLIQAGIPAVLAHQFRVGDEAAIELSRRFYEKLAAGEPVDAAVSAARLALANRDGAGPRDFATPVLYLRLPDESDGVLLPRPGEAEEDDKAGEEPAPNRWFWLNLVFLAALAAGVVPWLAHRWLGVDLLLGTGSGVVVLFAAWGIVDRLAGEHLNRVLRAWLRRPVATIGLGSALAAGGIAGALAPPPSVVVLLLPQDGVNRWLPQASARAAGCSLRLTVQGRETHLIDGMWQQAVFLSARQEPVTESVADGALTKTLLALEPAGEREEQRRRFYDTLLERRRVTPLRLGLGDRLRVETVGCWEERERGPLYDEERRISDLPGDDVRIWLLKGES